MVTQEYCPPKTLLSPESTTQKKSQYSDARKTALCRAEAGVPATPLLLLKVIMHERRQQKVILFILHPTITALLQ